MPNATLTNAQTAKNDEFYTQYADIQKEMNAYLDYDRDVFRGKTILLPCDDPEWSNFTKYFAQHFEELGLRKLISTSYAPESKKYRVPYEPTLFETSSPQYNPDKTKTHGKIFVLERSSPGGKRIDIDALEWDYLEGDGDFRSQEICRLRDEADIIITNPPFSMLRDFIAWLMEAEKKFIIIGNLNAIAYSQIFPLFLNNKVWLGNDNGAKRFYSLEDNKRLVSFGNCRWFTNIDHGRRHQPLALMTMDENIKHNPAIGEKKQYQKYDNYDAIEIPFVNAIPSDYDGIMGVPISFLEKHCLEQFEILGATQRGCHDAVPDTKTYDDYWEMKQNGQKTGSSGRKTNGNANLEQNDGKKNYFINAQGHIVQSAFQRIFIRRKQ